MKGLYYNKPKEDAPEFVKGSLTIYKDELIKWLEAQPDNKVEFDLLLSKDGDGYAIVNQPNALSSKGFGDL